MHNSKFVQDYCGLFGYVKYSSRLTHRQLFNQKFDAAIKPLNCIHLDLVGPVVPALVSGFNYILTIVDQSTSFKIIKFLKRKSDASNQFSIVKIFMENQKDWKIKRIVSDQGGEFLNKHFKDLAEECGITHILSPAEMPQHNGYAERANRTILEKTIYLLGSANLPDLYWAEALSTATLLSNPIPTPSRMNKSPYLLWTNQPP
ncbi:hypothetical protein O181_050315 [Austropuccinia psidii MF-1]|uniref:Integrase catalytic domain-containing protein n=1 Tax=Austropuccinia psidii MF-1 TaxID=1389203 RepID=A0A9Q3DV38_9BASI|nr:hypothetical protein [Austropuccinia psidii MF-1]